MGRGEGEGEGGGGSETFSFCSRFLVEQTTTNSGIDNQPCRVVFFGLATVQSNVNIVLATNNKTLLS